MHMAWRSGKHGTVAVHWYPCFSIERVEVKVLRWLGWYPTIVQGRHLLRFRQLMLLVETVDIHHPKLSNFRTSAIKAAGKFLRTALIEIYQQTQCFLEHEGYIWFWWLLAPSGCFVVLISRWTVEMEGWNTTSIPLITGKIWSIVYIWVCRSEASESKVFYS